MRATETVGADSHTRREWRVAAIIATTLLLARLSGATLVDARGGEALGAPCLGLLGMAACALVDSGAIQDAAPPAAAPAHRDAGSPGDAPRVPDDRWPMHRGEPSLAGALTLAGLRETPKLEWTYNADESIEGSAAIADGTIFIGTMDGTLLALELDTGALRWKKSLGGGITATPLVTEKALYVGDGIGTFWAIALGDQKVLWKIDTETEIHSSAVTDGERILFGAYNDRLYCVKRADGSILWEAMVEGPVHSTPALAGGKTFVSGCDEQFRVIDVATGKEERALGLGGYTTASPAAVGDRVYIGTYSCQVLAIDWKAGTRVWTFENPDRSFPYHASCAFAKGRVIAAGRDKTIHCLDAADGKVVWDFRTKARIDSSPLIVNDRVFAGSSDGNLYVLALEDGRELWSFTAGAPIIGSPAVARGRMVIGDADGRVYCFRIADTPGASGADAQSGSKKAQPSTSKEP